MMPNFIENIDNNWTLFLDRDGVINTRLPDQYVREYSQFEFIAGVKEAIYWASQIFDKIIIVTNQQGIGKGLMDHDDLKHIHRSMVTEIENAGGRIDQIYYCPHLSVDNSFYRKPNVGMAMMAKEEFPGIIFEQSIMIGDSNSDILFGKNSGMHTILIEGKIESLNGIPITKPDLKLPNLYEFGAIIKRKIELL